MLKRLAIVVFFAIVLPVYGQEKSTQNPAPAPSGTATCTVKEEGTTIECRWPKDVSESYFRRLTSPENAPNIGLFLVGAGGILVAVCTLRKIERQTAATEKQATHMVVSERPFIMVETRGPQGREFWIRNCGKSPAQILFIDPVLLPKFPEFDESRQDFDLPHKPAYGGNYDDDRWEQINVQWLAPGDEKCFASFSPGNLDVLDKLLRSEINNGTKAVFIYSSVKYRGMFSPDIYHSRFCYQWGPLGTFMTGPPGYNQYT